MKKTLIKLALFLTGVVILAGGALAALDDISPVNSILNPVNQSLYMVRNDATPQIQAWQFNDPTGAYPWRRNASDPFAYAALPTGSACYGLTINAAGDKLYVSVNNGRSSEIRVYNLTTTGWFTLGVGAYTTMTGTVWGSTSSPAGLALDETNHRLYVADKSRGGIYVYNTETNAYIGFARGVISGSYDPHFDVAIAEGKLFVSNKAYNGLIHIYSLTSPDAPAYVSSIATGTSTYPSRIKVSNGKIFVAMNGTDGIAIKVYNATDNNLIGSVRNGDGMTASYDWTSFDVDVSGRWLVYAKPTNVAANLQNIYAIKVSDITLTASAFLAKSNVAASADGLTLTHSRNHTALTYSPTGTLTQFLNGGSDSRLGEIGNHDPMILLESMGQFRADGVTPLPRGATTTERVIVHFYIDDGRDGDMVTPVLWYCRSPYLLSSVPPLTPPAGADLVVFPLPQVHGDTLVTAEIPAAGRALASAGYQWGISVTDEVGLPPGTPATVYPFCNTVPPPGCDTPDFVYGGPIAPNNPPAAFRKLIPIHEAAVEGDVAFSWEAAVDPDAGDTVTYNFRVVRGGSDSTDVVSERPGIADTAITLPASTFTTGGYSWFVTAVDNHGASVEADGGRVSKFEYNQRIYRPGTAPSVTATVPTNGTRDVLLDAPISITFSESMTSPVIYTITPSVSQAGYWNADQTVMSISHAALTPSTTYTIEVVSATDIDDHLPIAPLPYRFSFTTTTEGGTPSTNPVTSVSVTREGNDVVVQWTTTPGYTGGVDIYSLTCNYNTTTNSYDRYFSTDASAGGWTRVRTADTTNTFRVAGAVGNGTAQYYKLIGTGTTLATSDLTREVVGKFDIRVGTAETFFISLPLVPATTELASIIGNQANNLDNIFTFDIQQNPTAASAYNGSTWGEFAPGIPQISNLNINQCFGYGTSTARYITIVGRISETDNSRPVEGGAVANWLATAYALPTAIQSIGLNSTTVGSSALDAATVYLFDQYANPIGDSGMANHTAASTWTDIARGINTTTIIPGRGYMFTEPNARLTWTQPRPY